MNLDMNQNRIWFIKTSFLHLFICVVFPIIAYISYRKICHSNTYLYFPICRCWPWLLLLMTLIILRKLRLITLWMHHMFFRHVGRSVHLFKFIYVALLPCSIYIYIYILTPFSSDLFCLAELDFFFLVNQILLTHGQVVKPLLQERTKKKIQVLYGSGRDELLKVKIIIYN
jgi:hypothetical protein